MPAATMIVVGDYATSQLAKNKTQEVFSGNAGLSFQMLHSRRTSMDVFVCTPALICYSCTPNKALHCIALHALFVADFLLTLLFHFFPAPACRARRVSMEAECHLYHMYSTSLERGRAQHFTGATFTSLRRQFLCAACVQTRPYLRTG